MQCGFEVKGGSSKDEVLQIAAVHAKAAHNIQSIPAEVAAKVNAAIKS
jgi:predicted small metal-binding protein